MRDRVFLNYFTLAGDCALKVWKNTSLHLSYEKQAARIWEAGLCLSWSDSVS